MMPDAGYWMCECRFKNLLTYEIKLTDDTFICFYLHGFKCAGYDFS
jgi:hypothetical protein